MAEKIDDKCPECHSRKRFWHCYSECGAHEHVVTCRDCKAPYLTKIKCGTAEEASC